MKTSDANVVLAQKSLHSCMACYECIRIRRVVGVTGNETFSQECIHLCKILKKENQRCGLYTEKNYQWYLCNKCKTKLIRCVYFNIADLGVLFFLFWKFITCKIIRKDIHVRFENVHVKLANAFVSRRWPCAADPCFKSIKSCTYSNKSCTYSYNSAHIAIYRAHTVINRARTVINRAYSIT